MDRAREALDLVLSRHNDKKSENVIGFFVGSPVDSWDSISAVARDFPIIIASSAAVVVLLLGIVFRSILIPLRSVLSLALTVSFVFGSAALVFDNGILDWLHFSGLHSSGGLTWLIPVICFSIVIGVSLDYEIFLLTRIIEVRNEGYGAQDAIRLAQYKTGPVISIAGAIMAVAFSGLILSSSTALNQMGFILSVSVLVDTFVFRLVLVPSLMSLFGEASFWPRKMPDITQELEQPNPIEGCCRCLKKRQLVNRGQYRQIN